MIFTLKRLYWSVLHRLVVKRSASQDVARFKINNTFIMPTRFGWSVIAVMFCLFVLGTNYQNNVILSVSYFLASALLLSIFHAYFYFVQHRLTLLPIEPDFENRRLKLTGTLYSEGNYQGGELQIQFARNYHRIRVTATATKPQNFSIKLPKYSRGIHNLPLITVSGCYGFGFFRCWSYMLYPHSLIVYPGIERAPAYLHSINNSQDGILQSDTQLVTSDNLQGIRPYQRTDPIHHVSWKHVAKGQGMVTKDFLENTGVSGWLKLTDYQHLDIERALKIMCFQIQELDKSKVKFGLDLGTTKILPNIGESHLNECLLQLASFRVHGTGQALGRYA